MPVTDNGYEDLIYEDEVDRLSAETKQQMGADIDTSINSNIGQMIRVRAKDNVEKDQQQHDVYDSAFKDTSTGVSLDRLASNYGIQRQQAQSAEVQLTITGKAGYVIPEDTEFTTEDGISFLNATDTQIDDSGTAVITVYSDDTADYVNVPAKTITVQANPVDEIEDVTNLSPATGGADLETDYDLRKRIDANSQSKEGPTRDGLKTGMLNVNGVGDAFIVDNDTAQTDDQGNPPWTVHVYVKGGKPENIAQKLLDIGSTNSSFVGDQVVTAYDQGGHAQEIRFDYVNDLPIYVSVTLIGENIDTDTVKQSIIDYVDDVGMGNKVVMSKLLVAISQNDNVEDTENLQMGTEQNNLGSSNIEAKPYQNATTDESLIEVNVKHG